jgi:hypothetical protein
MRHLFLAIGLIVIAATLVTMLHGKNASFDRLAARVERAKVIPNETRDALRHLIDTAHHDGRNAAAIARIEQALRTKPIVLH